MKIKSITAAMTSFGDQEKRSWGKDIFLSFTAVPEGQDWSLEEAEVEYMKLCKRLSVMSFATLLSRNMITSDSYTLKKDRTSGVFDMLIEQLSKKLEEEDKREDDK